MRISGARRRSRSDLPRGRGFAQSSRQTPLAQGADDREEQRDEEDPDGGRDEHPEEHARADRVAAPRPRAPPRPERRDAPKEGERGHEHRPPPPPAPLPRPPPRRAPP